MLRFAIPAALLCGTVGCVAPQTVAAPPSAPPVASSSSGVPVSTAKACSQHCDVIAVFDLHTSADSQDKGFDELRQRAGDLGADAVIDAEFEHGDDGGPSHLSGMAVRYTPQPEHYEEIGPIDIQTPENATDKGLDEMRRRGLAMGADEIVGVTFEHGDDGAPSRLHGTAVRFIR